MKNQDYAQVIDFEEIPQSINPSNQSNQIVNFINLSNSPAGLDLNKKVSQESLNTVVEHYNAMNTKYGFELKFDLSTLNNTFMSLRDPLHRKAFHLYLSDFFEATRFAFYQRTMMVIMDLFEQISSPAILRDPSIDPEVKLGTMERMFGLMQRMEEMYKNVKVDDIDIQLRRLKEQENNTSAGTVAQDPKVLEIMEKLNELQLNNEIKDET